MQCGARDDLGIDTQLVEAWSLNRNESRSSDCDFALHMPLADHAVIMLMIEWIVMRGLMPVRRVSV